MITKQDIQILIEITPHVAKAQILETEILKAKSWDVELIFNNKYHYGNGFIAHIYDDVSYLMFWQKIEEMLKLYK